MKNPPTLIDQIYAATFVAGYDRCDPGHVLRNLVHGARRFVLDERMAGFMLDLSVAGIGEGTSSRQRRRNKEIVEGFRAGARLPHKVTWIEYPMIGMYKYATFAEDRPEIKQGLMIHAERWSVTPWVKAGWLVQQHKSMETAFIATWCAHRGEGAIADGMVDRDDIGIAPISYVWCTDDGPLPWRTLTTEFLDEPDSIIPSMSRMSSALLLVPVDTDCIGVIPTPFYYGQRTELSDETIHKFVREAAGDTRMLMALLACINDIPIAHRFVKAAKGFVARGSYRRFLDHTTISLTVPATFRLAKQIVVGVARRRAHEVRGHWRKDHWHPGTVGCEHQWRPWGGRNVCSRCGGHRLWIPEHQRGDASLGFVTHDYEVHH